MKKHSQLNPARASDNWLILLTIICLFAFLATTACSSGGTSPADSSPAKPDGPTPLELKVQIFEGADFGCFAIQGDSSRDSVLYCAGHDGPLHLNTDTPVPYLINAADGTHSSAFTDEIWLNQGFCIGMPVYDPSLDGGFGTDSFCFGNMALNTNPTPADKFIYSPNPQDTDIPSRVILPQGLLPEWMAGYSVAGIFQAEGATGAPDPVSYLFAYPYNMTGQVIQVCELTGKHLACPNWQIDLIR